MFTNLRSKAPHAECEASGGPLEGGSRDKGFSEVTLVGGRSLFFALALTGSIWPVFDPEAQTRRELMAEGSSVPTPLAWVRGFVTYLWGKPLADYGDFRFEGLAEGIFDLLIEKDSKAEAFTGLNTANEDINLGDIALSFWE